MNTFDQFDALTSFTSYLARAMVTPSSEPGHCLCAALD